MNEREIIIKELLKIAKKDSSDDVRIKSLDVLQNIVLSPTEPVTCEPVNTCEPVTCEPVNHGIVKEQVKKISARSKVSVKPNLIQELSERIKHRKESD